LLTVRTLPLPPYRIRTAKIASAPKDARATRVNGWAEVWRRDTRTSYRSQLRSV